MNYQIYENYVVQIVRCGSLTKAAELLGISQPALSSGLSRLESELGYKLFNRRASPISLTEEGTLYYSYLREKRVLEANFRNQMEGLHGEAERKVIAGSPVAYMEVTVLRTVNRLLLVHPEYEVTLKCAPLRELIGMAEDGQLNCFICTANSLPAEYVKLPIKKERIFLCLPREHPINADFAKQCKGTGSITDFSALNDLPFISLDTDMPLQQQADELFMDYGVRPLRRLTLNQASSAVSAAAMGLGFCLASEDALSGCGKLDQLRFFPLPEPFARREIFVAYHSDMWMPGACKDFIAFLTDNADE